MLDMMLYGHHHGAFLGDSAYRCRNCGGGPVTVSDGFLMSHCMNCGNWQGSHEPIDLGLGAISTGVASLFKKVKVCLGRLVGKGQGDASVEAPAPGS